MIDGKWWYSSIHEGFDVDYIRWFELKDGKVTGRDGKVGSYRIEDNLLLLTLPGRRKAIAFRSDWAGTSKPAPALTELLYGIDRAGGIERDFILQKDGPWTEVETAKTRAGLYIIVDASMYDQASPEVAKLRAARESGSVAEIEEALRALPLATFTHRDGDETSAATLQEKRDL